MWQLNLDEAAEARKRDMIKNWEKIREKES